MTTAETAVGIVTIVAMSIATLFCLTTKKPWLAIIPGISIISHANILYAKSHIEQYRYADWSVSIPLMLLALLSQNNMTSEFIYVVLFVSILMVACNFFGINETDKTKKLAWFGAGVLLFLPIAYVLFNLPIEKTAAIFLLVTLSIYEVIWALRATSTIKAVPTNITYLLMDTITKIGLLNYLK